MKVYLPNPRGFCAGVDRAIEIVNRALDKYGAPIYVRHEVVHNKFVVDGLKAKGVIFVDDIAQIPAGAVIVFSAHGVAKKVRKQAETKTKTIFDATCPLVTKVHKEVIRNQQQQKQVILIGHANHPEVEGTLGQADNKNNVHLIEKISDINSLNLSNKQLAYTTQTTLSIDDTADIVDALQQKFPSISPPHKSDICYATQNRQDAVKEVMKHSEILLVLGSVNSSNSNRLKEIATKQNKPAYLIDNAKQIKPHWLKNIQTIGVTAGASAPELLVQEVVTMLKKNGGTQIIEVSGSPENITFPIPKTLRH